MAAPIRDQILTYLKINQQASVAELSAALAVTKADIRYHINSLIDDRLVETVPAAAVRQNRGRGRPAALFQLTVKASPDNYRALAEALLHQFLVDTDQPAHERAAELARLMFPRMTPSEPGLVQVLNSIVADLNRQNYAAHWEAHRDGPGIFFDNCPYAAILNKFPQLCEMDRQFLSQRSGLSAVQLQRFDTSRRKTPGCLFRLQVK